MMTSQQMAETIVGVLANKIGSDIRLLKIDTVSVLADYFVICTAKSTTQIKTLTDEVEAVLEEKGERVLHREGYRAGGWVLLDYKTDFARDEQALLERYGPQLRLYKRALEEITGTPVSQAWLCLLRKEKALPVV